MRFKILLLCVRWYAFLFFVVLLLGTASGQEEVDVEAAATPESPSFGVDVSFPTQHAQVTGTQKPFGDSVMPFYNKFLQGCRDYYKDRSALCDESELSRLNLNRQQPSVMQVG